MLRYKKSLHLYVEQGWYWSNRLNNICVEHDEFFQNYWMTRRMNTAVLIKTLDTFIIFYLQFLVDMFVVIFDLELHLNYI